MDRWQFKIRSLRKKVKEWNRNIEVARTESQRAILAEIDFLDSLVEQTPLTAHQRMKRQELKEEIEQVWKMEEIRARQRARDRDIKEGDKNTSYFFALVNQRKRKTCISCLIDGEVTLSDNRDMLTHVVSFYKKLFGKEPRCNIRLGDEFWGEEDKIFGDENDMLEAKLSKEEIHMVIKASYAEGAPCPDGFSFLFYQKF
jgi:hypothetical protein